MTNITINIEDTEEDWNRCLTPGRKIRSRGKGRGIARGRGRGPIGIPIGDK